MMANCKEQVIQAPMRVDDDEESLLKCAANNHGGAPMNSRSYGAFVVNADGSQSIQHDDLRAEYDGVGKLPSSLDLSMLTLKKIESATKISLLINVTLFIIKIAVFIETGSFAVIAALTDSFCDLVSQLILYCTQRAVKKQHTKFPAGRTRLEPVGILIMAILMIILSCSVVFASIFTLYSIYVGHSPFVVEYSDWSLALLVTSIVLKSALWIYCRQFTSSPSAMALAEDHRNDVLSNGTALVAVIVAGTLHSAVWVDPAGGALISIYIIWSWYHIATEEVNKLIGIRGDEKSMDILHDMIEREMSPKHRVNSPHDYRLSAYYIGRNMLVELRLIYAEFSDFRKICDSSLQFQHKLEAMDFIERAFVIADYQKRKDSLHKIPMLF